MTKIALIGCGKMGSALLQGWIRAGIADQIDVIDPSATGHFKNVNFFKSADDLPDQSSYDVLALAVKPQIINEVCPNLKKLTSPNTIILSIVSGKPLSFYEGIYGQTQPVVRTMPNTPASIGMGMIVGIANKHVSNEQRDLASALMQAGGRFEWIEDETLMDAVTALSGSGPAYIFYLIEALSCAGTEIGLTPDLANILARQTVIGSAMLAAHEKDSDPATLRDNVTSPNGTTAAALSVLMDGRFDDLLVETLLAASNRSKELAKA
jgi:pyrroline-5-carboxylate reductase